MRTPLAQDVAAPELDRIDAERSGDDVGLPLVGPHQLRDAEAAQRAGRRLVRVDGVVVEGDVLDVVRAGGGEAGLLRHARPDVRVRAAVPVGLDLAGDHPAVVGHAGLDAHGRAMLGDGVELLVHRQGDAHRLADEQRADGHQRFELDVQLRAEPAAEVRRADAHAIFGPPEQAADLGADERGTLRCGVNGQAVRAVQFGQRHHRLERRVDHLAAS